MKKIFISLLLIPLIFLNKQILKANNYEIIVSSEADDIAFTAKIGSEITMTNGYYYDSSRYDEQYWLFFVDGKLVYQSDESFEYEISSPVELHLFNENNEKILSINNNDHFRLKNYGYFREKEQDPYMWSFYVNDSEIAKTNQYMTYKFRTNYKAAVTGKDIIINNVSNPYTIEQIFQIANIKAIDPYDGDITHQIELINDTYSSNKNKVGQFSLHYQVTNSAELTTTYVLTIYNVDITKPIITGPLTQTISYRQQLTIEDIIAMYTVEDNVDTSLTLQLEETNYIENKVGEFYFIFSATDSSNNKAEITHTLTVIDDIKPYFIDENENKIQINFKEKITNELLLLGLSAYDEIDGNITKNIKIISNPLKNVLGQYEVKYEVTDKAGNKTTHTRIYEVITTDYPQFYVSYNLISIEDVNSLTVEQIVNIIANYEQIEINNYEILIDEYTINKNKPGKYLVQLKVINNDNTETIISRTINVFNKEELINKSPNIITKILNNIYTTIVISFILISIISYLSYKYIKKIYKK